MATQQVFSRGIYHGLPTFPQTGLTAIITGANGISGYYMLKVLAQAPERWTKIYCLSRRPPLIEGGLPPNAEHIALDFLKSPEEISSVLKEKNIKADYVFFYSYIQPAPKPGAPLWSNAQELADVNSKLLENFLGGLKIASIKPKAVMLQTGAKNYGVHLGPVKQPQEETDPRVTFEPNFYYPQEDLLWKYCEEEGVNWNILMPGPILGAVPDAAMNICFPLAVYASVCRKLGQPIEFPGDIISWQVMSVQSSSTINAYMEEWAVLTPAAQNQKFNVCDNSAFTWEATFPRIAGWYGIDFKGPDPDAEYKTTESRFIPRGYGPKGQVRRRFSMVDWAKREDVKKAWKELAEEHNLPDKEFKDVDRVFAFLDGGFGRTGALNFSMDKSRKMGWHGFVDSCEAYLDVFEDLAKLKMIPPVPRVKLQFN